jgi:nitrate/nitrite transporter NarK
MERQAPARRWQAARIAGMQPIHGPSMSASSRASLEDWRPEDKAFWSRRAEDRAAQSLDLDPLPAAVVRGLDGVVGGRRQAAGVGFKFTTDQLFWLAALPGSPARRCASSTPSCRADLRRPAVDDARDLVADDPGDRHRLCRAEPDTPYWIFLVLALLCGFGGGNFASSMANISFFFPKAEKGNALALNAASATSASASCSSSCRSSSRPACSAGSAASRRRRPRRRHDQLWLQNAGFIWVPFIAASAFAAWFGMNDIASMKASFAEQSVIFQRKHNWIMCWLYTGTFGSFIGYSAGFPLLAKTQFPEINALQYAFLGPLVGALSRSLTGWVVPIARRRARHLLGVRRHGARRAGRPLLPRRRAERLRRVLREFLLLFFASGVGNASTFQMIPAIMRKDMERLMPNASRRTVASSPTRKSAAIIGFTSAIAAYGAFFIPKSFGTSIAMTGGASGALYGFLAFYLSCIFITWFFYTRRGGLLFDVERGRAAVSAADGPENPIAEGYSNHVHFLDRLTFFKKVREPFADGHGITTERSPLGGRLSQALAARQDRALDARRQLHRLVLVEDLRQGRHRHLGDAADRLSAHAARAAEPRTARLLARGELQLVSLFRQPREVSAGPLAPAAVVARGARHPARRSRPGRRSSRTPRSAAYTRSAASAASCARLGRSHRDHRRGQRLYRKDLTAPTASSASRRSRPCRWSPTPRARATCR